MRTLLRHARLSRFLRGASLAAAPLMLAATAQAAAVFDAGGLRIDAAQQSQRDVNTGQSQTFRITAASFQGEALCGAGGTLGRYLHPDDARLATRPYYCLSPVLPVGPDSVLMFFRDSNETFLAGLTARGGRLRVERLWLSEDEARDTVETRKLLDARMPGWSRVQTDWTETALIHHESLRVVRLGAGMLLDIDGDTAFLMTPPGETVVRQEPNRLVTGPGGASYVEQGKVITRKTPLMFRAVRWRDGAELARLEVRMPASRRRGWTWTAGRPAAGRAGGLCRRARVARAHAVLCARTQCAPAAGAGRGTAARAGLRSPLRPPPATAALTGQFGCRPTCRTTLPSASRSARARSRASSGVPTTGTQPASVKRLRAAGSPSPPPARRSAAG